jgi:hypothetical protein
MNNKAASVQLIEQHAAGSRAVRPKTKNGLKAGHGKAEAAEAALDGESPGKETPRWHPFQGRENVHLHM